MGMASWAQTPTFRGYNSFHGFYTGGQDYYTHMAGAGYDFHKDASRECGAGCSQVDWASQGLYSTHVFTSAACDVIASHAATAPPATPLFLYLAYQAVHSPDQVPASYTDPYNATIPNDAKRRTFAGMLSALDEGVGNVTAALRAAGMEENTLVIFVADNGGPIACADGTCGDATGTSNFPLRGGKHSLYEGGTRVMALAAGPMLYGRGENHTGLMHHVDWLPTLLEAAGVDYAPAPGFELHGASHWRSLTQRGTPSPRNETVLNIDPFQPAVGSFPKGQGNAAIVTAEGWKLLLGLPGPPFAWSPPNSSASGGEAAPPPPAAAAAAAQNCSASSTFLEGVCLPGGDVGKGPVGAGSAGACCAACAALQGCAAFTWRRSSGLCYLKGSAAGAPTSGADCTSWRGGQPPPPSPDGPYWPLRNDSVALYNVLVDEEEREDLSAAHPEIVAQLRGRLAAWAQLMTNDYWAQDSGVDPRSDPKLRNGTWSPWL
jgi:arylsulfatase A-like enzyme